MYAQNQCAPVGWATQNGGTTGGGNATPVTVTTLADLISAANSSGAKVIYVSGTMGAGVSTRIKVSSNKTIFGLPGATIKGGFDVKSVNNVIIRNLKIQGPGSVDVDGVDCISIDNATNVWLDHLDIYDGQDGNLDVVNGSSYVSITWCKFRYTSASQNHQFCNLIGNSDSKTTDRGKLKVTFQYNWWAEGVRERMPRVRFGQVHIVNNLFTSTGNNQCVRAALEANLLIESNVFRGVNKPIDLYENDFTAVTVRNNSFISTSGGTTGSGTAFTPSYTLSITPVANVESMVRGGAGATLSNANCSDTDPNDLPTVSLTSPAANATFTAPATVAISANAADADGTVSKVEFYNGSTLLGSDVSSPYSFSWTNVAAGTYSITAKATDNDGAVTTSSARSITVTTVVGNQSPTVSLTSPAANATFTAPATVAMSANAADSDGTVSKVEFYNGSTLLGSDATSPYSFSWTNVAAGTYSITAKATDDDGAVTTSSARSITVTIVTSGSDINGPACGTTNQTLTYQLNSALLVNATTLNWWYTGSAQSISPAATGSASLKTGTYFSSGDVCVGVNYSVSPYYKQYCKSVIVCNARFADDNLENEISTSVYPNPSTGLFMLNTQKEIASVEIKNLLGEQVEKYTVNGTYLEFGAGLSSGNYAAVVRYRDGGTDVLKIFKTE